MKGIITIVIIIIIIVVGFMFLRDGTQPTDDTGTITTRIPVEGSDGIVDMIVEDEDASIDTTGEIIVVTYDNEGFSPREVRVSQGQTVRFVNESSRNMWVGSAMHPDHVVYSGTKLRDHCPDTDGTAFDQCESGDLYEFTFMKKGEWGYHNHVAPSKFGKIIVE